MCNPRTQMRVHKSTNGHTLLRTSGNHCFQVTVVLGIFKIDALMIRTQIVTLMIGIKMPSTILTIEWTLLFMKFKKITKS